MTRKRLEEVKAEALAEINQIRVALGQKPRKTMPKGTPMEPGTCPIANLLSVALPGVEVGSACFFVDYREEIAARRLAKNARVSSGFAVLTVTAPLPRVVQTFIRKFDEHAYPELVIE